ncbi:hypothetical protein PR202_ga23036 [Eleusine coracana subsp. coracana]|uniref:Uncharacterized protein n=1 Tax=Eleusine coracana subsp. coracana TaxID=191504 RepID=A0AAV5D392_ELECO|nr:hypothetical protein PR202_ga23036 [Eleusine coracana subsp. coracana]
MEKMERAPSPLPAGTTAAAGGRGEGRQKGEEVSSCLTTRLVCSPLWSTFWRRQLWSAAVEEGQARRPPCSRFTAPTPAHARWLPSAKRSHARGRGLARRCPSLRLRRLRELLVC